MEKSKLQSKEHYILLPYPKISQLISEMLFYKTGAQEHSDMLPVTQV